jgi:hypothetical protein
MKIVNTKEIGSETKTYLELAEKERVSIKYGRKYVNLIVSNDPEKAYVDEKWVKEFLAIPEEFRVNPFEVSPSGDLYFADKRNLDALDEAIASGESREYTDEEIRELLGA